MAIKRLKLMADFETTTDPNDCRVWAGCAVDIEALEVAYIGNDLDGFMEYLSNKNTVCYFHNLKFDGEFILHWLFSNGYRCDDSRKDKTFSCLITDDGLFYSIEVIFHRHKSKKYEKVVFYDSLKKLPFKVAVIAKAFELKQSKGSIDYRMHRPRGYELTPEEKEYIITDCQIVAEALKIQFEQGLKKMTNASDALNGYKSIIGKTRFESWFPVLPVELDLDIRRAYKGGFVYLNPKHKNRQGLQGITLDVNSLYPSVMYYKLLPYGYPMYFEGRPKPDGKYPLYIVHLKCCFELKPGHLPTLQLKNNRRFVETEYLTTSRVKMGKYWDDDPVEMWLTSVDYELFLEHYDISEETYINGFKFKGAVGMFKDYIDYWMHIKDMANSPRTPKPGKRYRIWIPTITLYVINTMTPNYGNRFIPLWGVSLPHTPVKKPYVAPRPFMSGSFMPIPIVYTLSGMMNPRAWKYTPHTWVPGKMRGVLPIPSLYGPRPIWKPSMV